MPVSSKQCIVAVSIAAAVGASWVSAYRMGAGAGRDLAGDVAGVPVDDVAAPVPPLPPHPATARPPRTAATATGEAPPLPGATPVAAAAEPPPMTEETAATPSAPSPEAVDQFLATLDDSRGQALLSLRLQQATQDLGLADIPETIDALAALPAGPKREAALLAVVGRWAQLAPESAVDYANAEAIPALRTRMIQSTFSGWALADPAGALAYLDENPEWPHREAAANALFEAVSERPMGDALAFLESVDQGTQGALIHRTVSRLLALDPLAVRGWAEGLPDSGLREAVLARSVSAWANYSPVEAKDWIMANYEGDELAVQLPRLAGAWARNQPEAALDWYMDLPGELQSARVGEEVFESWLRVDRDSARTYLDDAAPRTELDQGFKEYAYHVQREHPAQAMDLTAKITDDSTRSETQSRVARYWAQRNPRAVLGYLESSSIPVEDQAPLIRYAESRLKQQTQRNRR